MDKCKKYLKHFDKFLDSSIKSELSTKEIEEFDLHLETCSKCANEFENLKNTLTIMNKRERPEPSAEFIKNFWDNLEPKLSRSEKKSVTIKNWFSELISSNQFKPQWSFQIAGAAAILILGILIGKYFMTEPSSEIIPSFNANTISVQQAALVKQADRYIDRSKVLLLGLMNVEPNADNFETINLQHQKIISKELLTEAVQLKKDLNKPSNRQLQKLIADLEVILMQIATLEVEEDLSGIELIQSGIDRKGIFLKINIREMNKTDNDVSSENEKNNNSKNNSI